MFQKNQKESFIEDYLNARVVAKTSLYSLFRKTSAFEEELNKDCSEFTKEEIFTMYKKFEAKSINVLLNYNVILKAYARFVNYNNTGEINGGNYEDLTKSDMLPFVSKHKNVILTREEVNEIQDHLFNWVDKAIIECLFEGISGSGMNDLVGIADYMIDHDTMILYINKNAIQLTERLYGLLMKTFEEEEYICYGKTLKIVKLAGKGRLYKERPNAHAPKSDDRNFRWVYRKIQNYREFVGIPQLTMKNIEFSGMVHYLKIGVNESGLDLRSFLKSNDGAELAKKYNYYSEYYVENCYRRFVDYI